MPTPSSALIVATGAVSSGSIPASVSADVTTELDALGTTFGALAIVLGGTSPLFGAPLGAHPITSDARSAAVVMRRRGHMRGRFVGWPPRGKLPGEAAVRSGRSRVCSRHEAR